MAQKLVLSVDEGKIQLQDLMEFLRRCEQLKFGPRTEINVENGSDEKFLFTVAVPESAPRGKITKAQVAVVKQIKERQEAVAAGEPVEGHVPAIIKTPVQKLKCPVCNVIKPLTRTGFIKAHMSHGKKCEGSGISKKSVESRPDVSKVSAAITAKRVARRAK